MDNLNTYSLGSLYEAFEPAKARALAERLEIALQSKCRDAILGRGERPSRRGTTPSEASSSDRRSSRRSPKYGVSTPHIPSGHRRVPSRRRDGIYRT